VLLKQSITYKFQTEIKPTFNGKLSRTPHRLRALRSTKAVLYATKLPPYVDPTEELEELTLSSFKTLIVFPFYPLVQRLASVAPSGTKKLHIPFTGDFEEDFPLIIAQHRRSPSRFPIHFEYNFVNLISDYELHLRDPLINSYEPGNYVFPAMLGVPHISESRSMAAHGVLTVSLEVQERLPTEDIPPSDGVTNEFIYQPKTVVVHDNPIDRRSFWAVESGRGDVSYPSWSKNPIRVEHKYSFYDSTWRTLRDAFFYAKGRCKTISVPTWKDGTSEQLINAYFTDDELTLDFIGEVCQVKVGWEEAI